jgi:methionyl-tRNA formyltransferase
LIMKVIFMGTPDFSVPALTSLIASSHEVIAVYSQPPRPKGRGQSVQKSPVHQTAEAAGIPVLTPLSFKKDPAAVEYFKSLQADVAVVAAYGLILPVSVLEAPTFGCLNIHASLLPRWRGASPIQHAVWHRDAESGITIMQMNEGLDTGDMISKITVPLSATTTASSLHDELAQLGGGMVIDILDQLDAGKSISREAQDEMATCYARMLKKEDGKIDWAKSAADIDAQVRALNPWPGTFTFTDKNLRCKIMGGMLSDETASAAPGVILKDAGIACGDGRVFQLERVQPDNGKPMRAMDALNGGLLKIGSMLS